MKKTLMVLILAAFVQVSFAQDEKSDGNAWEERCQQLERKVDSLSQNIKEQTRTVKRLTDENDKLRSAVATLRGKCNDLADIQDKDRADVNGKTEQINASVDDLSRNVKEQTSTIKRLTDENASLRLTVDTLHRKCNDLADVQNKNRVTVDRKIEQTNASVESNTSSLKSHTYWGIGVIVVIVLIIIGFYIYISRRIKRRDVSIVDMRKAQDALEAAQSKLQEKSVKYDNTLVEIIEKQLKLVPVPQPGTTYPDHSFALKVADEIVRIEMNLSRMDPAVKGHKQLSKAVQRLRDNFKANGYEIVEMLGKPYDEGMKADVNFVSDDTLPEGQQIITGITKPQINYNGKMIQKALITVSQNI